MSKSNFAIKTPHAAFLVWNYVDRISIPDKKENKSENFKASGVNPKYDKYQIEREPDPVIISTLSCISLSTSKSKSSPQGQFNVVLAPYKNWVSTLTAGSWCAILMSNKPITQNDIKLKANPSQLKMLGRIETVRCETSMTESGARQTLYYVSGTDWGDIFNSVLYVDNLLLGPNDTYSQGNGVAAAIQKNIFGDKLTPQAFHVPALLNSLLDLFGKDVEGRGSRGDDIGRLGKSVYTFTLPNQLQKYLQLNSRELNKSLKLTTGVLKDYNKYDNSKPEAIGYMNPFAIQGTHSLWQILLENSNNTMNELFCDLVFEDGKFNFKIFNRIKPFYIQKSGNTNPAITSHFKNIKCNKLNNLDVISVNLGTNWRDKFNFVEIQLDLPEFKSTQVANATAQKIQKFDREAFDREGFRPLIFNTRQFPTSATTPDGLNIDYDQYDSWTDMLRAWYFGTHKMLNGTITLHGVDEYISVGDNIMFDAELVNPSLNYSSDSLNNKNTKILAHVESIKHSFTINSSGARTFITTIDFVRGVLANENRELIGDGSLDALATSVTHPQDRNRKNIMAVSDPSDPDDQKIKA